MPPRTVSGRGAETAARSPTYDLHNRLACGLLLIVGLCPLLLGGNRPVFWLVLAAGVGVCGLLYSWQLRRTGCNLRIGFAGVVGLLGGCFCFLRC